ncbi:MAG: carboxymuconolactone decarboxylase family protein [Pirellulales bacterium]
MPARLDHVALSPELFKAFFEFHRVLENSSIERPIRDLVNIRASQLNGCAFCVDMHVKEAAIAGERPLRLHHVTIWRESTLFSPRERAALEWTEALTKIGPEGVSDELFAAVREYFSEKELSDLAFAVAAINGWNRLNIGFRTVPGSKDIPYGLTRSGLS